MPPEANSPPSPGLSLEDVYYIVFRHKWKIILCSLVALCVAAVVYLLNTKMYISEAKLLVRYVVDSKPIAPSDSETQMRSPISTGESIINSELEILKSFDLAMEVVDSIGSDKILPSAHGETNRYKAAVLIAENLTVEVPNRSNIIKLTLRHGDPLMVQTILNALIDAYFKKHVGIHRSLGMLDDFLSQQTDQLRSRLAQTEDDLRKLKVKAGVISFDETKKGLVAEIGRLRDELFNAEAQLAVGEAVIAELEKLAPVKTETDAQQFDASVEKINEYKGVISLLDVLSRKQQELRGLYTEESSMVSAITRRIADAESRKAKLETEFPKLKSLASVAPVDSAQRLDPVAERAKLIPLKAKVRVLNSQLDKMRTEAMVIDDSSITAAQLERKKQIEETAFRSYSAGLEQARTDEAIGVGRMSNISKVQAPSPPMKDPSKVQKYCVGILVGGLATGLALAFLLELVIDQTIKRPNEIEKMMGIPLYLAIPQIGGSEGKSSASSRFNLSLTALRRLLPFSNRAAAGPPQPNESLSSKTSDALVLNAQRGQALQPFHEALRDRIVMFFEQAKIVRKPKLIGVTGWTSGAGVTTTAAGLAASLSETGDGKVLLIDLNLEHGGVHPFFKGAPACGLVDLLDNTHPESASVQERLYLASASGSNGSAVSVRSKQFTDLMPKLKASDYDYIVFDLPPINQTSATIRLAGFMDKLLVVIEPGRTQRSVVKRSLRSLGAENHNVAGILNKTPCVVPQWLRQQTV